MTGRIKFAFRWPTENELIGPEIVQALNAVAGLKRGRCDARETDPIRPVDPKDINAIEPFVTPHIWAIIQLQLHTAARAGELLKMRPIDLNMTGEVWSFKLDEHKTSHHGFGRIIYIGPKGQDIIRPFLNNRPVDQYLFSLRESELYRHSQAGIHRRPDQLKNLKKTTRIIRDYYSVDSYRRAIQRACVNANIPAWAPHRLRHTTATNIREDYGLEAAQVYLGHASCDVTQVYAEADQQKAIQIAKKIG
jgi:integrase